MTVTIIAIFLLPSRTGQAKPYIVVPIARIVVVAIRTTLVAGIIVPAIATIDPFEYGIPIFLTLFLSKA